MKRRSIGIYSLVCVLSLVLMTLSLRLWNADLTMPLVYQGDGLQTSFFVKSMIDNGWYIHNYYVGAPFGSEVYDYPMADNFSFAIMKLISLFTHSYGLIINIYYALTFIFSACTATYVFHKFRASYFSSIVGGLLFAFLPYHFLRNEVHLFLSAYFMIPLVIMVALWILRDELYMFKFNDSRFGINILWSRKTLASFMIALLLSSTGIYYAFFGCFFLLVAGLSKCLNSKRWKLGIGPLLIVLVVCIGVLANLSPSIVYTLVHGTDPAVAHRNPAEADIYGMKIAQLFIPVTPHGFGPLNSILQRLINRYSQYPLPNEGSEYLGIIGAIGFLLLIMRLMIVNRASNKSPLNDLAILNVGGVLLGTIGGFGSLVALALSPEIRAYNRISVYLGFFSIFLIVTVFERYRLKVSRGVFYPIATVIALFGLYDQTNNSIYVMYGYYKAEYQNDANFVSNIEAVMPKGAMIFQLPYVAFPENPPINNMGDYELFRGYLHSTTLKWSYGGMKGRAGDLWETAVANQPVNTMVKTISLAGFDGIYIDSDAYTPTDLDGLTHHLSSVLHENPMRSQNGVLIFYNLMNYNSELRSQYSPQAYGNLQYSVSHPLLLSWTGGFSTLEGSTLNHWRWSSNKAELDFVNLSNKTLHEQVSMSLATGYPTPSKMVISSNNFTATLSVGLRPVNFSKVLSLPPGTTKVYFFSSAQRVVAPNDPRVLVFRVINFKNSVQKQ